VLSPRAAVKCQRPNLWVSGRRVARAVFGPMGQGISPYPYAFIFPQDEHERLLIDRLSDAGVRVERETAFVGLEERDDRIIARLERAGGRVDFCEAAFVAGCDGAHSRLREVLSIGFAGGTYEHLFYVADVEAHGPAMNGDLHVALDRTDFLAVFPSDRRPSRTPRRDRSTRGGGPAREPDLG
jgi:2-polyprenyl-6-methoxyphenol hydroxylase-like FAD-dependent oxidoreductase